MDFYFLYLLCVRHLIGAPFASSHSIDTQAHGVSIIIPILLIHQTSIYGMPVCA